MITGTVTNYESKFIFLELWNHYIVYVNTLYMKSPALNTVKEKKKIMYFYYKDLGTSPPPQNFIMKMFKHCRKIERRLQWILVYPVSGFYSDSLYLLNHISVPQSIHQSTFLIFFDAFQSKLLVHHYPHMTHLWPQRERGLWCLFLLQWHQFYGISVPRFLTLFNFLLLP